MGFRAAVGVLAGALLLTGCGLLPGEKPHDWAGLAQQIVTESGSDDVVDITMGVSGGLTMTVRVGGTDERWTAIEGKGITFDQSFDYLASSPVKVADIEWADHEMVMLPDCPNAIVKVDFLPYGHVMRDSRCQTGVVGELTTIDGVVIPSGGIETPDAAGFDAAISAMETIFPDGQVLAFEAPLAASPDWKMVGPKMAGADGRDRYLVVIYGNDPRGLGLYALLEDDPTLTTTIYTPLQSAMPELTFRPSEVAPEAHAAAIEDGLSQVQWSRSQMLGMGVYAPSDTELAWTVWRLMDVDVGRGTFPR